MADARARLEELYRTFDHATSAADPVHIVRRYEAPEDREVVGFCAAALAFGRVASVLQSVESLLEVMGPHPATFVRRFEPVRHSKRIEPLVHRWIRGRDLVALLLVLQRMLKESRSIEGFFLEGDDPTRPDISQALDSFSQRALDTDLREVYRTEAAEAPRGLLLLSAALRRQCVQAAESVPALDGAEGCDRSGCLDPGPARRA